MAGSVEPTASIGVAPRSRTPGVDSTAPPTPNMPDRIPDANPAAITASTNRTPMRPLSAEGQLLSKTAWDGFLYRGGMQGAFAAIRQPATDAPDAFDEPDQCGAGFFGLGGEPFELLYAPVAQDDRCEDLLVMRHEIIDAGARDCGCVVGEVDDAGTRHLEL